MKKLIKSIFILLIILSTSLMVGCDRTKPISPESIQPHKSISALVDPRDEAMKAVENFLAHNNIIQVGNQCFYIVRTRSGNSNSDILVDAENVRLGVTADELSMADRKNGIEYRGKFTITADTYRFAALMDSSDPKVTSVSHYYDNLHYSDWIDGKYSESEIEKEIRIIRNYSTTPYPIYSYSSEYPETGADAEREAESLVGQDEPLLNGSLNKINGEWNIQIIDCLQSEKFWIVERDGSFDRLITISNKFKRLIKTN